MSILRPARRVHASDSIRATRTLLADGGALARFPGAVALVNPSGAVICTNAAGAGLEAVLGGGSQRLAATVAEAIATGDDCSVTLVLPAAESGDQSQLMLSILPLAKGEAALVMGQSAPIGAASIGAVASARRRYKDLLSLTGDFAWETNAAGVFTFVSEHGGFGWPAEAMVGHRAAEFLVELSAGVDPFLARVPVSGVPLVFRRADGGSAPTSVAAMPVLGTDSGWLGARGVAREDAGEGPELRVGELVHFVDDDFERAAVFRQATG
jgi:hypothetical protein